MHTIPLSERVYAMDAKGAGIVAVCAGRQEFVFNIAAGKMLSQHESPLKYQTRCVSIFTDESGYACGSIEGRVSIEYYDELGKYSTYTLKWLTANAIMSNNIK